MQKTAHSGGTLEEITRLEARLNELYNIIAEKVCTRATPRINPAQALLLARMPKSGCEFGDLARTGIFNGTNPSYPVNQLIGDGYLASKEHAEDRRRRKLRLTAKGKAIRKSVLDCLEPA
jgi:DNA-binding MarR family transcriptional regulator